MTAERAENKFNLKEAKAHLRAEKDWLGKFNKSEECLGGGRQDICTFTSDYED